MPDDPVDDAARQVRASVREAIGRITGDGRLAAEGAAEKAAGRGAMTPAAAPVPSEGKP